METIRILSLGDSITRGSYLRKRRIGPDKFEAEALPNEDAGGYRKPLQDMLREAGIPFDFVGDLSYWAFGRDGVVDPAFDPDHHGLAGFSNAGILNGGVVPTPPEILKDLGVAEVRVSGIIDVLKRHRPDIILLMSGTNGFDAKARDRLIRTIGERCDGHLIVATIPPIRADHPKGPHVAGYNRSLPDIVKAQQQAGKRISFVDMHAAISVDQLLEDGVHPGKAAMQRMAEVWFHAIAGVIGRAREAP